MEPAEVEERGRCSGRESLPWAAPYDVWLTGYTLSSPEPLTSLFLFYFFPDISLSLFSPLLFLFSIFLGEGGNSRRATSRVKWPRAATCSKGGGGSPGNKGHSGKPLWAGPETDRLPAQITPRLMYWLFAQHSVTTRPGRVLRVAEAKCVCVCVCVRVRVHFSQQEEKGKTDWQVSKHNTLNAPPNIPEMTAPVLKIFHTKVVILFMEANLGQIQNLQTT